MTYDESQNLCCKHGLQLANIKPENFADAQSLMNSLGPREMAYVAGWNLVYTDGGSVDNDATTDHLSNICLTAQTASTPIGPITITPAPSCSLYLKVLCSNEQENKVRKDFYIQSPSFVDGCYIPSVFTCSNPDVVGGISPQLQWNNSAPLTQTLTKSFLLVVDDPDGVGGTVIHWILFNIPPTVNGLEQNIKHIPTGTRRGKNVFDSLDYVGPCPPDGNVHRYHFKLMALDCILPLAEGATIDEIDIAISGHVISATQLEGLYEL